MPGIFQSRWAIRLVVLIGCLCVAAFWTYSRRGSTQYLTRAVAAYETRDWSEAFGESSKRLREQPDDPDALRLAARAAIRMGQPQIAQPLLAKLGPERMHSEDFLLLGMQLARTGNVQEAWDVVDRVSEDDLNDPELLHELARLFAGADRLDRAAGVTERLSTEPGWEARAAVILGLLRSEQSDPAGTVEALSDALRRDPTLRHAVLTSDAARKLIARNLLQLNQPAAAEEQLQPVLKRGPDPEAFWILSRAMLQQNRTEDAHRALERAGNYPDLAATVEPAPFVGSDRCSKCHATIAGDQAMSRHARTLRRHDQMNDVPLPAAPVADSGDSNVTHSFERHRNRIVVTTSRDGSQSDCTLEFAVGALDRAMTPLVRDSAGRLLECRLSLYARADQGPIWQKTSGQPDATGGDSHLGRVLSNDAVRRCFSCHTTDLAAVRDNKTEIGDCGISCERCHGPGGNHVLAAAAGFSDLAIARTRTAPDVLRLCGQCHSPRGSSISSDDPSAVRFQAAALVRSHCYIASQGRLDCITCHDPHRDALTTPEFYESKCISCHQPPTLDARPEATHPTFCPINRSNGCINCHMPQADKVMPHSSFTDHQIRRRNNSKP